MKIVNLMEDTAGAQGCTAEHGLSFYIETPKHKILVDAGATGQFADNAKNLGIDLRMVDIAVLSHGHYDHGNGLLRFRELSSAPIYIRRGAEADLYHVKEDSVRYIGLPVEVKNLPQNVWVEGDIQIDEELSVFTGVKGRRCWPDGNRELMRRQGGDMVQDDFGHEQYLVISCEGENVLISGCAHNGILNILDCYRSLYGENPDKVVSGFHMMKKQGLTEEDKEEIRRTARELSEMDTMFFTGHCTGIEAYEIMKEIMGEKLRYIHCGEVI
ncbi:MAG: MBL fold metallo-hydrolase [Lachnospiraceae bacterium]|nr:MBL fold metallo-hydrolase [Lachnospiraceae bacterium]